MSFSRLGKESATISPKDLFSRRFSALLFTKPIELLPKFSSVVERSSVVDSKRNAVAWNIFLALTVDFFDIGIVHAFEHFLESSMF